MNPTAEQYLVFHKFGRVSFAFFYIFKIVYISRQFFCKSYIPWFNHLTCEQLWEKKQWNIHHHQSVSSIVTLAWYFLAHTCFACGFWRPRQPSRIQWSRVLKTTVTREFAEKKTCSTDSACVYVCVLCDSTSDTLIKFLTWLTFHAIQNGEPCVRKMSTRIFMYSSWHLCIFSLLFLWIAYCGMNAGLLTVRYIIFGNSHFFRTQSLVEVREYLMMKSENWMSSLFPYFWV